MVQIEEIARASGLTQLSILPGIPGSPPGGGNYSVPPVTMTFEGTYEELQELYAAYGQSGPSRDVNDVTYCHVPILDPEHSCTTEADEAAAETTTVDQVGEGPLQVQVRGGRLLPALRRARGRRARCPRNHPGRPGRAPRRGDRC